MKSLSRVKLQILPVNIRLECWFFSHYFTTDNSSLLFIWWIMGESSFTNLIFHEKISNYEWYSATDWINHFLWLNFLGFTVAREALLKGKAQYSWPPYSDRLFSKKGKLNFKIKSSWSKLVGTRRSTVPILPLSFRIPCCGIISKCTSHLQRNTPNSKTCE
jgi:hypothetical protein